MKHLLLLLALGVASYTSAHAQADTEPLGTITYKAPLKGATDIDSLLEAASRKPDGLAKLDAKYGFRDLKFETPATKIKGLVPMGKTSGGEQYYSRPTDSKKIGASTVSSITYSFYKGRLSTVTILTKGYTNSRGVLDAFRSQYGEPYQANQYIEDYSWFGEKVMLSYDQNSITDNATIYIWSKPILEQQDTDKAAAAKKAGSDL